MTGTGDMADTRIEYGDRTNTGIAVNWSAEGDTVLIFCPQASAPSDKSVEYVVKPTEGEPSLAASVDKTEAETVGLRWGDENNHYFYAFYPASELKGTTAEEEEGIITADIPVLQTPISWPTTGEIGNQYLPIPPTADRTYFGEPDLTNSFMYAYNLIDKAKLEAGTPVSLQFHNLVTVLDITIPGPENAGDEAITVTNISVDVVSGTTKTLTGLFEFHIKNGGTDADGNPLHIGDCVPLTGDKVSNRLSIPCYNPSTTEYIKIGYNETLNVKAYVIPDTEKTTAELKRQFKITVSTMNGAKSKTLDEGVIEVQKVNRILLPNLVAGGVDYWMSNLDPDIYITELSIPGSHQSAGTQTDGKNKNYQNSSLTAQFEDGIRAFSFQTAYTTQGLFSEQKIDVYTAGNRRKQLYEYLQELTTCLETQKKQNKREFVIVNIGYKADGTYSNKSTWFNTLLDELKNDTNYKNLRIYDQEINAETTIGELAGTIVLRIDTDKTSADYPMLMSDWVGATTGTKDIYWKTNTTSTLKMYGHDGTSINVEGNTTGQIADLTTKSGLVETVFNESVKLYLANDAHNTLYYNNLGGFYCVNETFDDSEGGTTTTYSTDVNTAAVDVLQRRTQNASLGMVMMNFADRDPDSGGLYKSDYLITTVIDNNFKFALRKKPSSTTTRGTYVRPRTGSDGWDEE